jgi:hypothetical protein
MSILLKDFKYETITKPGSTAGTDGYTSTTNGTSSASTKSYYYIPDGWTQLPDGRWIDADGTLQINPAITEYGIYYPEGFVGDVPTSAGKSITLSSSAQDTDMMRALYPGDYDGISYLGQNPNTFNQAWHHKLVYEQGKTQLGVAKYTYPDGSYLAFWVGYAGYGLYYFVGYSASNPPTQLLSTTSTSVSTPEYTSLWDAVMAEDKSTWIYEESEEGDESWGTLFDIGMADGYETYIPSITDGTYNDGTSLTDSQPAPTVSYSIITTMPAQEATTASSESLTYTEILKLTNSGWNSWARSIDELEAGKCVKITVGSGVTSACISVGPKGMEGEGVARFKHGIICDQNGVRVYENGAMVKTLYSTQTVLSEIRVYRQTDNTIVYFVKTGTSSVVHTSNVTPQSLLIPLYVYGYLYTAGDRVASAAFATGVVQYGSV